MGTARTFNSNSSTDMNNVANYTPSTGSLSSTDDLTFNSSGSVGASATADLNVGSITVTSAFGYAWGMGGHNLILNNSTGLWLNNTGHATGLTNSNVTLNAPNTTVTFQGAGTWNTTGCQIVCASTGAVIQVNSALTIGGVTLQSNASGTIQGTNSYLTMVQNPNGVIFGTNSTLTTNCDVLMQPSASAVTMITGAVGAVWNGSGTTTIRPGGNSWTITISSSYFTYSGTGYIRIGDNSMTGCTVGLNSNIQIISPSYLYISGACTFRCNGYYINGNVSFNGSGNTFVLGDDMHCQLWNNLSGTLNKSGHNLFSWGAMSIVIGGVRHPIWKLQISKLGVWHEVLICQNAVSNAWHAQKVAI